MSNFAFLAQEFPAVAEAATLAERAINADPRASCFHARHTLEQLVNRIYKLDRRLAPPRLTSGFSRTFRPQGWPTSRRPGAPSRGE
jgi:type I restriction enzyme, R subunit